MYENKIEYVGNSLKEALVNCTEKKQYYEEIKSDYEKSWIKLLEKNKTKVARMKLNIRRN